MRFQTTTLAIASALWLAACGRARSAIEADPTRPRVRKSAPRVEVKPTLAVRETLGKPIRIDGCIGSACVEWARYPVHPYRHVVETGLSREGKHFFVWSKADGRAREIDLYALPKSAGTPASKVGHAQPGFGGDLLWVEGERLWHRWGCGTSCLQAELRELDGKLIFNEGGSWSSVDADGRRVLVADHGGKIVLIDTMSKARFEHAAWTGALFPNDVAWEQGAVRVQFGTTTGDVTLRCTPAAADALECKAI